MLAPDTPPTTDTQSNRHSWMTVQRIITELHLSGTLVTTLGACFSGAAEVKEGDNFVGLMQSMLTAGTQTVAAGLWAVNDASTRLLFEAFYRQVAANVAPAKAMQAAAKLLQAEPALKHPYYWGAYQVNGLAHDNTAAAPIEWPDTLLQQIATIAETPTQRGTRSNASTIIEGAEILLKQMKRYQSMILDDPSTSSGHRLDAIDSAVVRETLAHLETQIATVQREPELLALANTLHTLIEEVPMLREWLLPEHQLKTGQIIH